MRCRCRLRRLPRMLLGGQQLVLQLLHLRPKLLHLARRACCCLSRRCSAFSSVSICTFVAVKQVKWANLRAPPRRRCAAPLAAPHSFVSILVILYW